MLAFSALFSTIDHRDECQKRLSSVPFPSPIFSSLSSAARLRALMLLPKLKEEEDRELKSQGTVFFFFFRMGEREKRERERRERLCFFLLLLFFFFTSRARPRNSIPSNPFVCQRRDATFAELNESQIQESVTREIKQTFSCVNFFARDAPGKKTSLSRLKVTTQRLDLPSERCALREGT